MLNSVPLNSPGACSLLPPLEPSLTASPTFFSFCLLPSLFFKWMTETLHPNLGRFLALLFLGPCVPCPCPAPDSWLYLSNTL